MSRDEPCLGCDYRDPHHDTCFVLSSIAMSIVTKTGDKGETGLFGSQRVSKADVRMHACGTIDELNAAIGLVLSQKEIIDPMRSQLTIVQNILFRLGADLATLLTSSANVPRIEQRHIDEVDQWIETLEPTIELPKQFLLPGGSEIASRLHVARTICRRAERWTVDLGRSQEINRLTIVYLNRLSDYLFLAAIEANKAAGIEDVTVNYDI